MGLGPPPPASVGERVGGEHGVEPEQLRMTDAEITNGREHFQGHVPGLVPGLVDSQSLDGSIAVVPGLGVPAQAMAGQSQQEPVEGRGVGLLGGPLEDGGGRRPVAEEKVGRPESSQAIPPGSDLILITLGSKNGTDWFVTARRNRPSAWCGYFASPQSRSTRNLRLRPCPIGRAG